MSFSDVASNIMEKITGAFVRHGLRPVPGSTEISHYNEWRSTDSNSGVHKGHFVGTCAIGALAFEARLLKDVKENPTGVSDEQMIAEYFGVERHEVTEIERGFDGFFEDFTGEEDPADFDIYLRTSLPKMSEYYQVGWHIAKKATEHFLSLEAAEEEAWAVYEEEDLKDKTWEDVRLERTAALMADEVLGEFEDVISLEAAYRLALSVEGVPECEDCEEPAAEPAAPTPA